MSTRVPLIKLYDTLLVPLAEALTDTEVIELREQLAQQLRKLDVRSLVLEVSGVAIFDSFVARAVAMLSGVASLLGVRTILVGLSPGIAITLSEMGIELRGVETTLDLESALDLLGFRGRAAAKNEDDLDLLGV